MFEELIIHNFILVDKVHLHFHNRLQVISGETGAGKSLILQAIRLLSGERLKNNVIGPHDDKATLIGIFNIADNHPLQQVFIDKNIPWEEGTIIIKRLILPENKSRLYVNDHVVTLSLLAQITGDIIEMQGQHDQRFLYEKEKQRSILDMYALDDTLLQQCAKAYHHYTQCKQQETAAQESYEQFEKERDYFTHILEELDTLQPGANEETLLQEERALLKQASQMEEAFSQLRQLIEAPKHIKDYLMQGQKITQKFDDTHEDWQKIYQYFEQAYYNIDECTPLIENLEQSFIGAADKLEQIEERLFHLREMARKNRCTPDELHDIWQNMRQKAAQFTEGSNNIAVLQARTQEAYNVLQEQGEQLHHIRVREAKILSEKINQLLPSLKLKGAVFDIAIEKSDTINASGFDNIQFMAHLNPSFPLVPIHKCASGGELSRLLLAVKVSFAKKKEAQMLIFDEIDAGIGGSTAQAVGRLLHGLSQHTQILAITHSPQIAAFSDYHFLVAKKIIADKAQTHISALQQEEKIYEIARMLSGDEVTEEALAQAQRLCLEKPH